MKDGQLFNAYARDVQNIQAPMFEKPIEVFHRLQQE